MAVKVLARPSTDPMGRILAGPGPVRCISAATATRYVPAGTARLADLLKAPVDHVITCESG